ncbi:MAG: site-specific integrase [Schwartzia sp.]|nr:site-specific integrase [Schwartzia sp. (in: firmicutes)]
MFFNFVRPFRCFLSSGVVRNIFLGKEKLNRFCGLTINDIDLKNRVVNIDHQIQRASDMRLIIQPTKTNAGTRRLPITEDVAACFQTIIEDRETPKVERMVDDYSGFLFLDKEGLPLVAMHWEHRFKHMVNRYNEIFRLQLPSITPHVCRHTYCSNMAKSGMNPKTLQYLMGHSEIGVTMNTYTHLGLEDATEELRKMEEERAREEIFRGKQQQQETRLSPRMLRVVQ